ncbi:MAG TPA: S1 RNA-binding domain-containing protein, partial [Acidimicrobiales bacterium]
GAVREATPPADPKVRQAIAAATEKVVSPQTSSGGRRRRRGSGPPPQAVNDPLTFIRFIADHPLGQLVEGEVESFTSHGAFVRVEDAQAYVPVSGLGDPPQRSARRALRRGERRPFVLQALDPQRRGVELALPEYAHVAGSPSEETVEAEISEATGTDEVVPDPERGATRKRGQKAKAPEKVDAEKVDAEKAEAGKGRRRAEKADGPAQPAKTSATKKTKTAAEKTPAKAAAKAAAKTGTTAKPSGVSTVKATRAKGSAAARTTKTAKKTAEKAEKAETAAKKATKKTTKDKSAGAKVGAKAKAPRRTATARPSEGRTKN